ncbi:hypothetical protein WG66_000327 [Moniliophthora roreri]|nr:hypothetical protein WG66_000327 [Moniliophthora roreri]
MTHGFDGMDRYLEQCTVSEITSNAVPRGPREQWWKKTVEEFGGDEEKALKALKKEPRSI